MNKRLYLLLLLVIPFALYQTVQGEIIVDVGNILWDSGTAFRATLDHAITANRVFTFPDATTTIVGTDVAQTLTSKTINADSNTLTNIENADIKAGANIDAAKIGTGVIDNTEFNVLNGITVIPTTLESLTNVTNVGCATGQTIIVSGGNWICGSAGAAGTLEQLTNVTDVGCATGQVRKASGGNWICADDDNSGGTPLFNSTVSYIVNTNGVNFFVINGTTGDIDSQGSDAETQIEYALNNLPSEGGIIHLGPGQFDVDNAIDITATVPLWLRGSGMYATTLFLNNAGNDRIIFVHPSSGINGLRFSDFGMDGNGANQGDPATRNERTLLQFGNLEDPVRHKNLVLENLYGTDARTGACIAINDANGISQRNVILKDCGISGAAFISDSQFVGTSNDVTISDSYFGGCTDTGIAISNITDIVVSNVIIENCQAGIAIGRNGHNTIINGAIVQNNTSVGFNIRPVLGTAIDNVLVTNSRIIDNPFAFRVGDSVNVTLANNFLKDNGDYFDTNYGNNTNLLVVNNIGLGGDYPQFEMSNSATAAIYTINGNQSQSQLSIKRVDNPPVGQPTIGVLTFDAYDDGGGSNIYARLSASIRSFTAGDEEGRLIISVFENGTLTTYQDFRGDLGSIDLFRPLHLNELATGSLPGCDAGFEGSIVYDDTTNTVKWCNGSVWATI